MKDIFLVLITLSIFLLGYAVAKKLDDYVREKHRSNAIEYRKGKH